MKVILTKEEKRLLNALCKKSLEKIDIAIPDVKKCLDKNCKDCHLHSFCLFLGSAEYQSDLAQEILDIAEVEK